MAGDWIKMRGNLWDDPRVARICDLTDSGEAAVVGALYWLWSTADQHTQDGCMPGLTLRQIDRKTGLQGFGAALVAIGWLADDPQGVVIQGFEEHNGASAKKRCQTAQRVAKARSSNAHETQQEEVGNAASVTGALAREEKRREEEPIPSLLTQAPASLPSSGPQLALVDEPSKPKGPPDCPHKAVLELWAETLPAMPQHLPAHWRGARADHLRARWRETAVEYGWQTEADGLQWMRKFFVFVGRSQFLTGRAPTRDPTKRPFVVELEWLVNPTNWAKVHEGKYHQEAA